MNHTLRNTGLLVLIALIISACAVSRGSTFQVGEASWYGPGFHGKQTANGESYNQNELTAAHRTLPFDTRVRVINMNNNKSVVVRINDRGPYVGNRIIDLSRKAAQQIDMIETGIAPVRLVLIDSKEPVRRTGRAGISQERYTIQLQSFESRREAIRYAQTVPKSHIETATVNDKTVYRVCYGNYTSRQRADKANQRLQRQGYNGFVRQTQNTRG